MTRRAALCVLVTLVSACSPGGTFARLMMSGTPNGIVASVALDLTLEGMSTHKDVPVTSLPSVTTLEIQNGEGLLSVAARFLDAEEVVIGTASGIGRVARGETIDIALDVSPFGAPMDMGGQDASLADLAGVDFGNPMIFVTPGTTHNFMSYTAGGTPLPKWNLTVTNLGDAPTGAISIQRMMFDGGVNHYLLKSDACSGQVLTAGAMCSFAIEFNTIYPGTYNETINVVAIPGGTVPLMVMGTAIPDCNPNCQ